MEVYKTELLRKSEEEADGGKEQVGNASKPEPEQPTEAREEQPLGCPENSTVPAEDETKAEPVLLEDQKTKEHKVQALPVHLHSYFFIVAMGPTAYV